jgi:hypothetical protein
MSKENTPMNLLEEIVADEEIVNKIVSSAPGTPESIEDTKAWLNSLLG